MNINGVVLVSFIIMSLNSNVLTFDSSYQGNKSNTSAIKTPYDALARVFEYTGFKEIKKIISEKKVNVARTITAIDSTTPFLYSKINSRTVWEIKLDSIYLDLSKWNADWVKNYNPKSFIIWIDSATGHFLKAYTQYSSIDPNLCPEPLAKIAEEKMPGEIYHNLLEGLPQVTLLEALNVAAASSPLKAKELIAYCVMYSRMANNPKPAWIIIGKGVPSIGPFYSAERQGPRILQSCIRSVIDAITGEPLLATNRPYIGGREKD